MVPTAMEVLSEVLWATHSKFICSDIRWPKKIIPDQITSLAPKIASHMTSVPISMGLRAEKSKEHATDFEASLVI